MSNNNNQEKFQLPALPPWRTPTALADDTQESATTPISKFRSGMGSRRLISDLKSQDLFQMSNLQSKTLGTEEITNEKIPSFEEVEYDYSPLAYETLLRDSKIQGFLKGEQAAHCLVFHKDGHPNGMDTYRPDIEILCGEGDRPSGHLITAIPGYSKEELNYLLNTHGIQNARPSLRTSEDLFGRGSKSLKEFWQGSDLIDNLQQNELHQEFLILQDELLELQTVKAELQQRKPEMHIQVPEELPFPGFPDTVINNS